MPASDLLDTLYGLFDRSADVLETVSQQLTGLLDSEAKREELRTGWRNFRVDVSRLLTSL